MATARSHSVVPNPKISAEVRGSKTHSRLALTDIQLASRTKNHPEKRHVCIPRHVEETQKKSSCDKQKENSCTRPLAFMCFGGPSLSSQLRTHPPSASRNRSAFIVSPRLRVTGPSRRNYSSPLKSIAITSESVLKHGRQYSGAISILYRISTLILFRSKWNVNANTVSGRSLDVPSHAYNIA